VEEGCPMSGTLAIGGGPLTSHGSGYVVTPPRKCPHFTMDDVPDWINLTYVHRTKVKKRVVPNEFGKITDIPGGNHD
jgi:hypothetical protein